MSITWGEFKKIVESEGVVDTDNLIDIDTFFPENAIITVLKSDYGDVSIIS